METHVLKKIVFVLKRWLEKKAASINQNAVIKDISREVDISVGYFLILTTANLIALSGLITNSAPVIIGAMLISPLMGPILSFGFAFITGEELIWKKSVKKIVSSVLLTLIIAAIAAYLSPLKDVTSEIVARTRPNLYDLLVAFLSGTAGAAAICTKKNYVTIVPGVAIATAVIPPLSVAGFGIGTGSLNIFLGGFFLFFTNFVAIIISTCIVFFLYGFRPSTLAEENIAQLKKRVAVLAVVLFVISIPLIYTLQKSISEVSLRNTIQSALKESLNRERESSLLTFGYSKKKDGTLEISAVVNTVAYLKESDITEIEKGINAKFRRNVKLYLEQVKVQPGGLKEEIVKTAAPTIAPLKQPQDILKSSRESVISVVRQSSEKIEKIISPSRIADFYVGFHDKTLKVSIVLKIKKDSSLSDEEMVWLKRIFTSELKLPVDLSIETVPFVPLLVFNKTETSLSEEMKAAIIPIRDVYQEDSSLIIKVEAYPGPSGGSKQARKLAADRVDAVVKVLMEECNIPEGHIETVIHKKTMETPAVKISVLTGGKTI